MLEPSLIGFWRQNVKAGLITAPVYLSLHVIPKVRISHGFCTMHVINIMCTLSSPMLGKILALLRYSRCANIRDSHNSQAA